MAVTLPRADDLLLSLQSSPYYHGSEMSQYLVAMKAELDPLFSNAVNQKAEQIINDVTALFDELFDLAKSTGANDGALEKINKFIEVGMTDLVHQISGYFDDNLRDAQTFISLLDIRRNEAIWCEVFTFYFQYSILQNLPAQIASQFISRFWDCFLPLLLPVQVRSPYYDNRLGKIFYDQIYGANRTSDGRKEYREPEYKKLFERHSLALAEKGPAERRNAIEHALKIPTVMPGD